MSTSNYYVVYMFYIAGHVTLAAALSADPFSRVRACKTRIGFTPRDLLKMAHSRIPPEAVRHI